MELKPKINQPAEAEILADLARLEEMLKKELPADLKDFFAKAAGTYPEPGCFKIQGFYYGDVDCCFGFVDSLVDEFEGYQGRVPEGFLPFGYASQGDAICYVLAGEDAGSIWFWDHEHESPEARLDRSNCYKCADSLQAFLDGLFDGDEEDEDDD